MCTGILFYFRIIFGFVFIWKPTLTQKIFTLFHFLFNAFITCHTWILPSLLTIIVVLIHNMMKICKRTQEKHLMVIIEITLKMIWWVSHQLAMLAKITVLLCIFYCSCNQLSNYFSSSVLFVVLPTSTSVFYLLNVWNEDSFYNFSAWYPKAADQIIVVCTVNIDRVCNTQWLQSHLKMFSCQCLF